MSDEPCAGAVGGDTVLTIAGHTIDFMRRGVIEGTILGLAVVGWTLIDVGRWLRKTL